MDLTADFLLLLNVNIFHLIKYPRESKMSIWFWNSRGRVWFAMLNPGTGIYKFIKMHPTHMKLAIQISAEKFTLMLCKSTCHIAAETFIGVYVLFNEKVNWKITSRPMHELLLLLGWSLTKFNICNITSSGKKGNYG